MSPAARVAYVGLLVAITLGCTGTAYVQPDCGPDEYPDWGRCIPLNCGGDDPFGAYGGFLDVVYVLSGAEESLESGNEDDPFRTIAGAVSFATRWERARVVVGPGNYREQVVFDARHHGISVVGACEEAVRMTGESAFVLTGEPDTEVAVQGFTVEGVGAYVEGGHLRITDVTVNEASGTGLLATGASSQLTLTDVTVNDTTVLDGVGGYGVAAVQGAAITATRLAARANATAGVLSRDPDTELTLVDSTISGGEDQRGGGLEARGGASAILIDTTIEGVRGFGVRADGESELFFQGSRVVGVVGSTTDLGVGMSVLGGSRLTARDYAVESYARMGVRVSGSQSEADLGSGRIGDAVPTSAGGGKGLVVDDGAQATARGLELANTASAGVFVESASAELVDSLVRRTQTGDGDADTEGAGIVVRNGDLTLRRTIVSTADGTGVALLDAQADLEAVTVQRVERGSQVVGTGVLAAGNSLVEATTLTVDQVDGPGLVVDDAASVTLRGGELTGNGFAAAVVTGSGTATFEGVGLLRTLADPGSGGGAGLLVQGSDVASPEVTLSGSTVRDNHHVGVHVVGPANVSLRDNVLAGGIEERSLWPKATAVFAQNTQVGELVIASNRIVDSLGAGLFFDGASASLEANTYEANVIDVVQQLCSGSSPIVGLGSEPAPVTEICPALDQPVETFRYAPTWELPEL